MITIVGVGSGMTRNLPMTLVVEAQALVVPPRQSFPSGVVGVLYSHSIAITSGYSPFSAELILNNLPPGLSLNGTMIVGTPTVPGQYTFNIRVDDQDGYADTVVTIVIQPAPAAEEPGAGVYVVDIRAGIGIGRLPTP